MFGKTKEHKMIEKIFDASDLDFKKLDKSLEKYRDFSNALMQTNEGKQAIKEDETVWLGVSLGFGIRFANLAHQKLLALGQDQVDIYEKLVMAQCVQLNLPDELKNRQKEGHALKIKDVFHRTLLMVLGKGDKKDIICFLAQAGVDVNQQDKEGKTALMHAVCQGNEKNVKALIEQGADLNLQDNKGKTALHYALDVMNWQRGGDYESIVSLLVEQGADLNIKNRGKKTPFEALKEEARIVFNAAKEKIKYQKFVPSYEKMIEFIKQFEKPVVILNMGDKKKTAFMERQHKEERSLS